MDRPHDVGCTKDLKAAIVSLVDVDTGRVVSVAPCSRKEGLTGECEYPVANAMLADADLSNATVSADLRTQRGPGLTLP